MDTKATATALSELIIHDPCAIDAATKRDIDRIGEVKYIVVPGSYHHLFLSEFQSHYPQAETYLCPELERKRSDIRFDWILGKRPDPRWGGVFEQVAIQGPRFIWEVPFFHLPSKTLILVDLLENIGDDYTHQVDAQLKLWWKLFFRMWNHPKAVPEYQIGWGRKDIVRRGLERVLDWEPEWIILAHGELIERDAMRVLRSAWGKVLKG